MSVNKVMLIGNIGADPEIRHTKDGRPIANIRLATSESWKDKQSGEKREKTEWHRIVCFNEGLCRIIEQYLKKGDKIFVQGQLQTRKWQDQSGQDKYSTEVILGPFKSELDILRCKAFENNGGRNDDEQQPKNKSMAVAGGFGGTGPRGGRIPHDGDMDDEIPF